MAFPITLPKEDKITSVTFSMDNHNKRLRELTP